MTGQPPLDAEAGYLTSQLAAGKQPGTGATSSTLTDGQDGSVRRTLPTVLGMRDLTLFMVLIVVFVSNTNGVQFGGPVAFLYWALGLITFLVPYAFVTWWLARRYPGKCAPYLWIGRILGPNWSFISAFCIWLPGVLAVVSVIDNGLIFIQYLLPSWFVTPVQQCLGIIVILAIATALTCLPLRWLKHLLSMFAILYLAVFALVGTAGLWWLESGHPAALALNAPAAWQPNAGNFPIYGVIILACLGVNIPLLMSGEVGQKRASKGGIVHGNPGGRALKRASLYVWWGTILSFLAYIAGTFGIMVIIPASQAGSMTASVQVINIVFGPLGGNIVDIVLALSQIAITMAFILMFARVLIVVSQDHRLSPSLASVNRHGVPVRSIIVQATIVACVTILSFVAVPGIFGAIERPAELAVEIYSVMQAGTAVVWLCSVVQLFVMVLWLLNRRKHRLALSKRSRMFQRVLLNGISLLGIGASLIGIWATVSSSWIPTLLSNDRWTIIVCGVISLSFMLGWFGSELPRMHALLGEQQRVNSREVALRQELQESYEEQQMLVQQQQVLLAEVDRLYREHALAAVTDAVTGLPNHRAVMSRLEEEVSRCQRTNDSCAVLFIDLDHFKWVNDTWGHRAGDAILHEIAGRLRATLRLEDFVGRYGGEEFAVVLTDADNESAHQTAERLRETIAGEPSTWMAEDTQLAVPIAVTGSIGIAVYSLHGVTREELVENADRAMYKAKHSGRNCVCIVDSNNVTSLVGTKNEDMSTASQRSEDKALPGPRDNLIQAVQALTAAASVHDQGTDDHAHRIIQLAEATARILKQPEEEFQLLHLAALLHDIGKIGIPDAILHKPGPLSNEEWIIMRRHPEIGRQILEQTGGVFQHLASIVVAHHERWDGHGYPRGLAAEAIPITARILSVVDAYDAMISRRPYREPLSVAEARAELQHCAGSQFDPSVVTAFLQVLDERKELQGALPGELARA
ncbi:MAG: amino acid permease [Ktedonobacteraceae bacterium]